MENMEKKKSVFEKLKSSKLAKFFGGIALFLSPMVADQALNEGRITDKVAEELKGGNSTERVLSAEEVKKIDEQNRENFSKTIRQNWAEDEQDGVPGVQEQK